MQVIQNLEALAAWVGREVASSDWIAVEQLRIQQFADATGDQQWIHVDPERARSESPYGGTIAHGFLTLSLLPALMQSCVQVDGLAMAINYGLDRVRLPSPVLAGQQVRARFALDSLDAVSGGMQARWTATVETNGGERPACVAEMLVRYYPEASSSPAQASDNLAL
jgi:acyl dehydratase